MGNVLTGVYAAGQEAPVSSRYEVAGFGSRIPWRTGYRALSREAGSVAGTQTAHYSLRHLAEQGYLDRSAVNQMLLDSDLDDFHWHQV